MSTTQAAQKISADEINFMNKNTLESKGKTAMPFKVLPGSPATATLPDNHIELIAEGEGDGPFSYLWSVLSGPGTPVVEGSDQKKVVLRNLVEGKYVVYVSVTDLSSSEYGSYAMDVFVEPPKEEKKDVQPDAPKEKAALNNSYQTELISETIPALPYEISPYTSSPSSQNYYNTKRARNENHFMSETLPLILVCIGLAGLGYLTARAGLLNKVV